MARIALIDSDHDCRQVCAAVLAHFQHTVVCFNHAFDAAENGAAFDVVVIDPGWNCSRTDVFIDFLRRHFPQAPLVLISGGVARDELLPRHTGVRLLAKPFAIEALQQAIASVLPPARDAGAEPREPGL
jgi:DNA-binding NtrC family response regulator